MKDSSLKRKRSCYFQRESDVPQNKSVDMRMVENLQVEGTKVSFNLILPSLRTPKKNELNFPYIQPPPPEAELLERVDSDGPCTC